MSDAVTAAKGRAREWNPLGEGAGIRANNEARIEAEKEWWALIDRQQAEYCDEFKGMAQADYDSIVEHQSKYVVKDSGTRDSFETGAQRDSREGKGRYDLIAPEFLSRLAIVLEAGAYKYKERNWEKGIPLSRTFDSLIRHLYQWMAGSRDEDHLGHAAANLMFLITTEARALAEILPDNLLDTPYYKE